MICMSVLFNVVGNNYVKKEMVILQAVREIVDISAKKRLSYASWI